MTKKKQQTIYVNGMPVASPQAFCDALLDELQRCSDALGAATPGDVRQAIVVGGGVSSGFVDYAKTAVADSVRSTVESLRQSYASINAERARLATSIREALSMRGGDTYTTEQEVRAIVESIRDLRHQLVVIRDALGHENDNTTIGEIVDSIRSLRSNLATISSEHHNVNVEYTKFAASIRASLGMKDDDTRSIAQAAQAMRSEVNSLRAFVDSPARVPSVDDFEITVTVKPRSR